MAKSNFKKDAIKACKRLLGSAPEKFEQPGGKSRKSARMLLNGRSLIITRRSSRRRAELEVGVLQALAAHDAPAPRVLAFDGVWLIQEDVGDRRLSEQLAQCHEAEGETWLQASIGSLHALHDAAHKAGLQKLVAPIGAEREWIEQVIAAPARLGKRMNMPAPDVPTSELADLLSVPKPELIKWDARPGNAAALKDGTVVWFDWEHCGCRNHLDDLVWLMADEFTPYWPAAETRLLDHNLMDFAGTRDRAEAEHYIAALGTFHMCLRLDMVLRWKDDGPWWDADYCLAKDKAGITLEAARRQAGRAAHWAARTPMTKALTPWLAQIMTSLPE